jgi:hypothetical protein
MGVRLKGLVSALVLMTAPAVLATAAAAQDGPAQGSGRYNTVPDTFQRALEQDSDNFFGNSTPGRQLEYFFGPGSLNRNAFPENEIARDAKRVDTLYRDFLSQQTTSDPYLRVPDLRNPYDTSVQLLPSSNPSSRVVGSELVFENLPLLQ